MQTVNDKIETVVLTAISEVCSADITTRRAKLEALEQEIKNFDQIEIPVRHFFHGDIYLREVTFPKGCIVSGRIHLFDHFEILISGDITVSTDTDAPARYTGYTVMKGLAGKKRAFFAHEESVFMTAHSSEERDPDEMYARITCGSFEDFEAFQTALMDLEKRLCL